MSDLAFSSTVLACIFGCVLFGMALQRPLPDTHLSSDARDIVKLGTGLIATLTALVLGLMIASAKSTHDAARSEVNALASDLLLLDQTLAQYGGPDATEARTRLRRRAIEVVGAVWPESGLAPAEIKAVWTGEAIDYFSQIQNLNPSNDVQHALQTHAMQIALNMTKTRFLLIENTSGSIATPFLIILVVWLSIIFTTFGLFAPRNFTVLTILALCSLSVSGAIFLVLELDTPFDGIIQVSSAPLRDAIAHIGQ